MKRYLFLLCVTGIFFLLPACKKDASIAGIQGSWELRESSSMSLVNYPPGNGHILRFSGNEYTILINGTVTQQGSFKIVNDGSASQSTCLQIEKGLFAKRMIYDNDNGQKNFFQLSANSLMFISGCFAVDGGVKTTYEKID